MGLSVDPERPGTLVVASLNRWRLGDALWRTTDGGRSWRNLRTLSHRDVSATPFLLWGNPQADFGWWLAGVAIDPFDSGHVAYSTGATVYATRELLDADQGKRILWKPWVRGVEQTAVITLVSPPEGPHLLSGFGDISGFAHEDLSRSPREQFTHPVFANTDRGLDYAGLEPNVVVRERHAIACTVAGRRAGGANVGVLAGFRTIVAAAATSGHNVFCGYCLCGRPRIRRVGDGTCSYARSRPILDAGARPSRRGTSDRGQGGS